MSFIVYIGNKKIKSERRIHRQTSVQDKYSFMQINVFSLNLCKLLFYCLEYGNIFLFDYSGKRTLLRSISSLCFQYQLIYGIIIDYKIHNAALDIYKSYTH